MVKIQEELHVGQQVGLHPPAALHEESQQLTDLLEQRLHLLRSIVVFNQEASEVEVEVKIAEAIPEFGRRVIILERRGPYVTHNLSQDPSNACMESLISVVEKAVFPMKGTFEENAACFVPPFPDQLVQLLVIADVFEGEKEFSFFKVLDHSLVPFETLIDQRGGLLLNGSEG